MKNTTDSTVEEDIGEIKWKQAIAAWDEKKTLRQVADETGLKIEVVNKKLKLLQKTIVKQKFKDHG